VSRIPDATIQEVRDRVDIVDLIGRYVGLKQAGRSYKGLCPFHSEKTPSFNVHRERQIFHCFGCGAGGNAITFLMRQEGMTFPEAVRSLARECGIEIPEENAGPEAATERLREANAVAQRVYRAALLAPEGSVARAYLAERGLDPALCERFGVGFAPDRWDAVERALAQAGIPAALGERAGLLAERSSGGHYDRLRARVTFPIQDVRGRTIGFGGRAVKPGQEPKYLNSPETPLFRKREALYGFPFASEPMRRRERAVLVEGYFDWIALQRAGIEESLATCGTALTPDHARALRRRVRELVLLFDGDTAGQRAVGAALTLLLPQGFRVRAVELPAGDDPDTFLAREGADALRELVDRAPAALEQVIRRAVERGVATPWQKADAVGAVAPLLALLPDPVERSEFVRRLALAAQVEVSGVEAAVQAARPGGRPEPAAEAPAARVVRLAPPDERCAHTLAQLLLAHPELAAQLPEAELAELLPEGGWRELLRALVAAAREGALDVSLLSEKLAGEAGVLLTALAASDEPTLSRDAAEGALADALGRLRRRRLGEAGRALTRRFFEDPNADPSALLAAKQRVLEERRAALVRSPSSGPVPGRS